MPSYSVLNDISTELQQQVVTSLATAPDISFTVTTTNLLMAPPSNDLDDGTLAVLYLYHVGIDPHLRNQPNLPDPNASAQFVCPPLPLQLKYLFVPLSEDEADNQVMLGRVLQHFHDAPTFLPAPGSRLATHRGGVPPRLRVRPDVTGFEAQSALWSALAQPYRLSMGFMVDVVAVDSAKPAMIAPRTDGSFAAISQKPAEAVE